MVVKCPVFGCEDSEKEFKTEAGLTSHIRNKHPEWVGEGAAPKGGSHRRGGLHHS